jgi:cytochrome b subunit of formate dehydrogenase
VSQSVISAESFPRFRLMARIEHAVLMVSFTILGVTGLPQKYALNPISQRMIDVMGGIELVRDIHRWAAFVLVVGTLYHTINSAYRLFVLNERPRVMPEQKDVRDLWATLKYNLGFQPNPPQMGKYTFGEKFEYWAVVWGTAVMVITGFMLWNPLAMTRILPGSLIPAAKAAHGGEAVLAVVSILVWHMYNVHFKYFNPSMFTGKLPRHIMEEEHALELQRLEAGGDPFPHVGATATRERKRNFVIVSALVGGLILALIIWAFTFEETAITTIPRATIDVFVPLATPAP